MYENYEREEYEIEGTVFRNWPNGYANAAIVFVHGLSGDPITTWGKLPELLMGTAFCRNKDIISYSYKSNKFLLTKRNYHILHEELMTFSETILNKYHRLYFITHSLGSVLTLGLIPSLSEKNEIWAKKIRGIILLAPALWGSPFAYFTFSKLARQLKPKSKMLYDIKNKWRAYCLTNNFNGIIIFGTNDRIILTKKDELDSLRLIPKSVSRSHIDIPKITNLNNLLYRTIINSLYQFDNANYYDSRNYILQVVFDSNKNEWKYDDALSELIYLPNFEIRIEMLGDLGEFHEPWTDRYPDHNSHHFEYQITYKGLRIHKFSIVHTDGYRYAIPLPARFGVDDFRISRNQYNLGFIIEQMGAYNDFQRGLDISGIKIDNNL
jgi:hypothetical protein